MHIMISFRSNQFWILTSGVLSITLCLTFNLLNVNAAAIHDGRRSTIDDAEAAFFLSNMNQTMDPCEDFYQFVCGSYINNATIAEEDNEVNLLFNIYKTLEQKILTEIKKEISPADLKTFNKVKTYYRNCMDESHMEDDATALLEILSNIGGWPVLVGSNWREEDHHWEEISAKINALGWDDVFPFSITVDYDPIDTNKKILIISSPKTVVTGNYISEDNIYLEAYEELMVDIAVLLGADRDAALKEMKDVVNFEVELYKIKTPPSEILDVSPIENRGSIKQLSEKYPDIAWLDVLNKILNSNNIFVDETEIIEVTEPKYVSELGKLIKNTPTRVLVNYQIWQVIDVSVHCLPKEFDDKLLTFEKITEGIQKREEREIMCMRRTADRLPIAMGAMYVRSFFDKETRASVSELVQNVAAQTKIVLENIDWMDEETRKAALEKVEAVKVIIGYPDELLDDKKVEDYYEDLEVLPGSFMESTNAIVAFEKKARFRQLNSTVNEDWAVVANVAIVNAFYYVRKNEIILPAGILQDFFFNVERPQYLNYGVTGYVIGHEIIHGFDTTGRNYDKDGNYKNWWQAKTSDKFKEKSKCLIEQYGNYTVRQLNQKMDGKLAITENIADNGGIKLAYHAYNEWVKRKKIVERRLPGLDYTPQQMFWIGAASTWCGKYSDQYLEIAIEEDPHSPSEARVVVAFSNMNEFANDFNCKLGSNMNPEKKCKVW